jgi:hypothetical protein
LPSTARTPCAPTSATASRSPPARPSRCTATGRSTRGLDWHPNVSGIDRYWNRDDNGDRRNNADKLSFELTSAVLNLIPVTGTDGARPSSHSIGLDSNTTTTLGKIDRSHSSSDLAATGGGILNFGQLAGPSTPDTMLKPREENSMRPLVATSAALLALAAGLALADETIDGPEFHSWSKFKPGTSITFKATTTAAEASSEATMTVKLLEVADEKVVLETSGVTKVAGMEFKVPTSRRDSTKTITIPKGVPKPPKPGDKPDGTYEEGTETIKAAGQEFKTRWYKTKTEIGGVKIESKMWICEDVPGTMVRMESKSTGASTADSKFELVEFKTP